MITRRKFLAGGSIIGATGLYSHSRGLRYPRLSYEHRALANETKTASHEMHFIDCIELTQNSLRAIAPEPWIEITVLNRSTEFTIRNIAPNATLAIEAPPQTDVNEVVDGLDRQLQINSASQSPIKLKWNLPVADGFEFAVMGDTGGGSELAWTLKRAHKLGAQFLLHLGDFNYSEGEYTQAIELFNSAPLPCYITIGNHDFHDNGLIYDDFLAHLGPMNHSFELAGARFLNIDTAADFWPANSGHRGKLFSQLQNKERFRGTQILFTHRPIKDPRPHDDHEVGSIGGIDYLVEQCKTLGIANFFHGHVHHSAELDFKGLRQFSIGEGLGHEDLVLQKPIAKLMIGTVEPGKELEHRWVDLNMPWSEHQSPTHLYKLKRDGRTRQIEWFNKLIATENLET